MSKKEKKKAKKSSRDRDSKKRKRTLEDDGTSTPIAQHLAAPSVRVSLDSNISVAAKASEANRSLAWGDAFAAAAKIQPEKLDEDFLRRTEGKPEDVGLSRMSLLAQEQLARRINARSDGSITSTKELDMTTKPEKKVEAESSNSDPSVSLEGRMIPHPKRNGEQVMVLVDAIRQLVYSALKRTDEGDLISIGRLESGKIVLDDGAMSTNEEETSEDQDSAESVSFPFPTDPDDHCESPVESYQDISLFLNALCKNGVEKDKLALYDPYYCNGAVVRNLSSLGFCNVHNNKVDCYETWSTGIGYPDFDVLITNPPYSGNHIEKLLQHVTDKNFGDRPWFLLMPNWVHKKDYYKQALNKANIQPFYLVPKKRYVYLPPKDFRDKRSSDVHKKSSPFVSMWYVWGGTTLVTNQWIELYQQQVGKDATCDLARSRSALRDLRRKGKKR